MSNRTSNGTIVIGGGLAGLTAANELARLGREVTVLELRSDLGGRARTDEQGGFRLNLGPHALYRSGPGAEVLAGLGIDPPGWDVPLDGARAWRDGRLHDLPTGGLSLLKTTLLGAREKASFGRLLGGLGRLDPSGFGAVTIDEWIADHATGPRLTGLLEALARLSTYASRPDVMAADALVAQLKGSAGGVRYLHGGWGRLVATLADMARAAGVGIETGVRVVSVGREGSGFVVDTKAEEGATRAWPASSVVLALGPSAVHRLVPSLVEPGAAGPPAVASVLDLGVQQAPTHQFVLGVDEPVYGSRHAPAADLAPEGTALVSLARYGEPDDEPAAIERQLREVADQMGIESEVAVLDRYLHRLTVTEGMPLAARGGFAGRPPVADPGHPGLALAGDWVGPRGLLADAALWSGREAARSLVGAAQTARVGS